MDFIFSSPVQVSPSPRTGRRLLGSNGQSMMAEAAYSFPQESPLQGLTVKGAFGADRGALLGNNTAFQLTLAKQFSL